MQRVRAQRNPHPEAPKSDVSKPKTKTLPERVRDKRGFQQLSDLTSGTRPEVDRQTDGGALGAEPN